MRGGRYGERGGEGGMRRGGMRGGRYEGMGRRRYEGGEGSRDIHHDHKGLVGINNL